MPVESSYALLHSFNAFLQPFGSFSTTKGLCVAARTLRVGPGGRSTRTLAELLQWASSNAPCAVQGSLAAPASGSTIDCLLSRGFR